MINKMNLLKIVTFMAVISASFAIAACDNSTDEWRHLESRATELSEQGQIPEAIEIGQQAVAFAEETFGSEHPNLAVSLSNLALNYGL